MMTSLEKDNHTHILSICEKRNWFGRSKESFRFFCQPSVPTMNREGAWCKKNSAELLMKPGGHGVIWKLARDEKIFEWLFSLGRTKALVLAGDSNSRAQKEHQSDEWEKAFSHNLT